MRAHLFQGDGYYPENGLGDYIRSFDDRNNVAGQERAHKYALDHPDHDWYSVIVDDAGLVEYYSGWKPHGEKEYTS